MLNKVILMGRLCADPELKQTQSGTATCRIRVAVNRQFANKQTGEREADFINVTCWRQTAEFVSKYFHKGSMIIAEGSLRNNDWTDQNGVKHYSMEVFAESVQFGESKQSAQSAQNAAQQPNTYQPQTYQASMQTPPQTAYIPQQSVPDIGDLGDFEEILGDGETPF